jgi:hypothetical protein
MLVARWIAAILLASFAVVVDIGNIAGPIAARKAGRNYSFVPFVGALSGAAACLACPWPGSAKLIPVAVLADISVAIWILWLGKLVLSRVRESKAP